LEDIRNFGPQPTIPYYTNTQFYSRPDRYLIDVDNDLVFAILGSGFMKFIDSQGNVKYSRYLWLNKGPDGNFYGASGRCADEFYDTNGDGLYSITAYLPKPGAIINRNLMTLEIDEVYPVERFMISRKLNTTMINLTYVITRMTEILHQLKLLQPAPVRTYEFKIRTLEMLLTYIIENQYEFDNEYRQRINNNQQVTQEDFFEMHRYFTLLLEFLPFLELD
jgi:hypothetical protein